MSRPRNTVTCHNKMHRTFPQQVTLPVAFDRNQVPFPRKGPPLALAYLKYITIHTKQRSISHLLFLAFPYPHTKYMPLPNTTGQAAAGAAGGARRGAEEGPVSSKPWGTEKLQKYLCYVKDTFTSVRLSKDAEVRTSIVEAPCICLLVGSRGQELGARLDGYFGGVFLLCTGLKQLF